MAASDDAERWFARGRELEEQSSEVAEDAYREAIHRDARFLAAYVNLGVLLQARGQAGAAERVYREAIARIPQEPLLHFNLGIALEDLKRPDEAIAAYERALALDPEFADAHYNVSHLHEARGQRQQALRHLMDYRRLQKS